MQPLMKAGLKRIFLIIILLLLTCGSSAAQNFKPSPNDTLSPLIIHPDNKVTFKVYAPKADTIWLAGPDIPNLWAIGKMTKTGSGIWEVTIGPLEPGAYRYNYNIDGVQVFDPKRADVSESNMNSWSLLYIPGADFMDTKDIPHGSVSEITYYSKSLNRFRRMHVYTPPGYENNDEDYPLFYLLHGALDTDDAWTTVGRAGFIIDNLIADNKALPMIIVMPAGHTGPFSFGMPRDSSRADRFISDFLNDIKPYIESHYRILSGRENTAMAGLSMGGGHTLDIGIPNLQDYSYLGIFSSGVFGIKGGSSFGASSGSTWEERNKSVLDNDELKEELKLIWFATGKDDFVLETSRETVKVLKRHGFDVKYKETSGGHTWKNWREYLYEFTQMLFK